MENNNQDFKFNKLYASLNDEIKRLDKSNQSLFTNNNDQIFIADNHDINTIYNNSIAPFNNDIQNNDVNLNIITHTDNETTLPVQSDVQPINSIFPINNISVVPNNSQDGITHVVSLNDNAENSIPDGINNQNNNINIIEPIPVVASNVISNQVVANNSNDFINYNKERINEIKNKSNNSQEVVFSDGIDTPYDDKKGIRGILTNSKFLLIVAILAFICVCIVVFKAFYFGKKVDTYEEYFTVIEKKEEEEVRVYAEQEIDNEVLKKVAASELISCINANIDTNQLPDSVSNVIREINNYYNSSNDYFAFTYKDIFTGFTVSYNANQNIFTASAIKGPTDIYIYEMASLGKINLDDELTYTALYYNTGSGLLKDRAFNTRYSIRTLLEYSTVYSDNAAHNMLMDNYGRENMLNFWREKGTTAIFTQNSNWGILNAHDSTIYMEELYKFYIRDDVYGEAVMKNFMNAIPKFIKGKNNYIVANKSGWSGTTLHDVAIVFADNPYIVVALSNVGTYPNYMDYFNGVNDLAYKLHTEYWKYKMDVCDNIKQY